jgi:hypothetical protein
MTMKSAFAAIGVLFLSMILVMDPSFTPAISGAGEKAQQVQAKQVEFFEAIRAGEIEVKLIPRDVREAQVLIENKGKQPLAIKLPEAFAGVPVLAQIGGPGIGGGGGRQRGGGGTNNNQQQGMGGGMMGGMMGGMGGMMGGMGGGGMMGGGMFNVAPEKVGKIKVATVCLEHGKRDPNPRVPYEIKPIEQFTKNQEVIEICKMLGRGELPQNTAQAAAWHAANGLSWEELARKNRVKLMNGYTEKYFTPQEITTAMRAVGEAARRAEQTKKKVESSESLSSLNQR